MFIKTVILSTNRYIDQQFKANIRIFRGPQKRFIGTSNNRHDSDSQYIFKNVLVAVC